jgi:hypothetical protein
MAVELKIKWEGQAQGLPDKRLSLGAFGEPLTLLLAALRRIATNIVGNALEGRQTSVGRFANAARQLDIEIFDLVRDSSGFDGVITFTPPTGDNLPLFTDLAERAGGDLLDALEGESQGVARNSRVRDYLRSLPAGLSHQSYSLHRNGTILRQVSFGEALLPEFPHDLPYIAHYQGDIVGVGFEPGRSEVRIKTESGSVACFAEPEQVNKALALRGTKILAVAVVQGNAHRLLVLQDAKTPLPTSTRERAVYDRWQGVLRRLAQ